MLNISDSKLCFQGPSYVAPEVSVYSLKAERPVLTDSGYNNIGKIDEDDYGDL